MKNHKIELTPDEALVLDSFFSRLEDSGSVTFRNAGEYLAILKLQAQIEKIPTAVFSPDYDGLLQKATERISSGFDGEVPGMDEGT